MSDKEYKNGQTQDDGAIYDSAYDYDHNGKIDTVEDLNRYYELQSYKEQEKSGQSSQTYDGPRFISTSYSNNSNDRSNTSSDIQEIIFCIILIVFCLAPIVLIIFFDVNPFVAYLLSFAGFWLVIAFIRFTGIFR